ncbi:Zn-ribbon domain-containing OB-fold protein [Halocatena marina]|uniref:Zn-ribbon domain-containing OB-fold protein n=1 Tax=Halocatena marina TaxID=2934937 RepID=A0ABD5YQB0_9EURY|nr:zinc ribbon domain-containing protein [Halocatena marina]
MSLSYSEWTEGLRTGALLGVSCSDCTTTYGTPVSVCHDCGGRSLQSVELPDEGILHSITRIAVPPVGFDGSYYVGIVEVENDRNRARLAARIESDEEPEIGTTVVLTDVIEEDPSGYVAPVFETRDER